MKMDIIISQTCESALRAALDDLVAKSRDLDEEFYVIAPETKSLFVERYLLDKIAGHAFCNIYIYTFSRLLKRLQVKPVLPLNKEAGIMMIRNIIMEQADQLVCYKKTAGTMGFAENIYETIQQLKSSAISPSELLESAKDCPTALKIKLKDIALLYKCYQEKTEGNLADPTDKLLMLERELELSQDIKAKNFYVVGFESLTTRATGVIRSILKNTKSLTVSAPFMHPTKCKNAHIADNEVFNHFKHLADQFHIDYKPRVANKKLVGDFKHIYENLYSYPIIPAKTKGHLKLFGATDIDTECKRVARLIKADVASGLRYKDICVYLANADLKDSMVAALEDFSIPYFSSNEYQFETHPLFKFIKQLFLMTKKNLEAEDVVLMARNCLLGLDMSQVDDFENYVLRLGINHGKFLKPFTIDDPSLQSAEAVRKAVAKVYTDFSSVYSENSTILQVCEAINAFLIQFDIEKKLVELEKTQNNEQNLRESRATQQAYGKVQGVLAMLSQFLGDSRMDLEQIYTLLISGMEAADISLLPLGIDMVQVVSSADGLYDIKNLYVVGATDGNFPRREQDLGLIQDTEITALEQINEKKIEPTIRTINRRERYKVFELLTLPLNKLTISFSDHSKSGEEEKMSSLVLSLCDLFTQPSGEPFQLERVFSPFDESDPDFLNFVKGLGTVGVAADYLASCLAAYKDGKDYEIGQTNISNLYAAVTDCVGEQEKQLFDEVNLEKDNSYFQGADKLFFKNQTTSISQLESYFACPFKHFAQYGLRLQDRKEASMRALDVGDVLHAVCEKFISLWLKRRDLNIDKVAENLLGQVLGEFGYSREENATLISILTTESKRLLHAINKQLSDTNFVPVAVEKEFGFGGTGGIELCKNPKVSVVGKIDRIDENDDFYRIIDYKTGKINTESKDVYYGYKLQLAMYLSAVENAKKRAAGVLYFPVHNEYYDGEEGSLDAYRMQGFLLSDQAAIFGMDQTLSLDNPKSRYIPVKLKASQAHKKKNIIEFAKNDYLIGEQELENIKSYAKAVSSQAVKEILKGYIKPTPFKSGSKLPCQWCEYRQVCGIIKDEYKSVRKAANDQAKYFYKGEAKWQTK